MRFVTFLHQNEMRLGLVVESRVLDLRRIAEQAGVQNDFFSSMLAFIRAQEEALSLVNDLSAKPTSINCAYSLNSVRLCPPIPRPGKIVAIGLNYRDHALEQGIEPPDSPLVFAKFPTSITGPNDFIVLPEDDAQVDYEAELTVVIGSPCRNVVEEQAMDHVAGYMLLNDVSARKWQFRDKQWTRGKSCDTFCPIGPWLTTRDEISDPHALYIKSRVNGELRQDSNTSNLIFRIPELIAYISASITLEPGDILATGTPPGVGVFRNPPVFLRPGDVVEIEIEKLGALRNSVTAAT